MKHISIENLSKVINPDKIYLFYAQCLSHLSRIHDKQEWRGMKLSQILKGSACVCLLLLGSCMLGNSLPQIQSASTKPLVPHEVDVLVVTSSGATGGGGGYGYLCADLARYGYNFTVVSDSSIDYLTDSRTSNLSQYDVVIVQGIRTSESPDLMTEDEVYHFVNYDGVLIVIMNAMMRNETLGNWWAPWRFTDPPMTNLKARLGLEFKQPSVNDVDSATFHQTNDSIAGLPAYLNYSSYAYMGWYHPYQMSLNGASQIYNATITDATIGITYYKNATGAIGIYINGIYIKVDNPETDPTYYGFTNVTQRASMLNALIAYALDKDVNTIIKPQPMASIRVDDYGGGVGYFDSQCLTSLNYLWNVCNEYGIRPSIAVLTNNYEKYPDTMARIVELQKLGLEPASHMQHYDHRNKTVEEITSVIDNDISNYEAIGLNLFTTIITPAYSQSTHNLRVVMRNKGLYCAELTEQGWQWTDINVTNMVLHHGSYNVAGAYVNFTQKSKQSIHYTYLSHRASWMRAVVNGWPSTTHHIMNFLTNEVGTYCVRTAYWNLTYEVPDIKFVPVYEAALYFANINATISSPSRSGSKITFTVNVDSVPTVTTIGKGMLWLKLDAGDTIQSVKIDDSQWFAFDDYSIKNTCHKLQYRSNIGKTHNTTHKRVR